MSSEALHCWVAELFCQSFVKLAAHGGLGRREVAEGKGVGFVQLVIQQFGLGVKEPNLARPRARADRPLPSVAALERASAVTNTKAEADKIGRGLAQKDRVELVIHGKNGRIQDSDSFGRDPNPPRDKKH